MRCVWGAWRVYLWTVVFLACVFGTHCPAQESDGLFTVYVDIETCGTCVEATSWVEPEFSQFEDYYVDSVADTLSSSNGIVAEGWDDSIAPTQVTPGYYYNADFSYEVIYYSIKGRRDR